MRILFLTARPPWPPRRGDQARAAGFLDQLAGRHECHVVSLQPVGFPEPVWPNGVAGRTIPVSPAASAAGLLAHPGLPWQVALHAVPRFRRVVREAVSDVRPDVAVVVLSRLGWVVPALGDVPVVLDLIDALALNMRNRARYQRALAPLLRFEAARMARWDARLIASCSHATVVSARDRDAVLEGAPQLADRVSVLPFGIAAPEEAPTAVDRPATVILTGNLGYFPTAEGAVWLAERVWPAVRARRPEATLLLAGARPAGAVRRLGNVPGVRVIADPPELAPLLRQAVAAVAPMRAGSGTPIKALEAMAAGTPVVATPAAAAGLDGIPTEAVAVAGEPSDFAAAIIRLLSEPERAHAQATAAWAWVRQHHETGRTARAFEDLLGRLVTGSSAGSPVLAHRGHVRPR